MQLSPQQLVTPAQNAGEPKITLVWACWAWLCGVVLAGLAAAGDGADPRALAAAVALGVSPSFSGFLLVRQLGRIETDAGWIAVWILAATGLVAGAGGWASPLTAALLIGPAITAVLRPAWTFAAGCVAVTGYALAAWLGAHELVPELKSFPPLIAAISIVFATALFSFGGDGRTRVEGEGARRIAEVSHELRTPLNHILGFSEMIERQMFGEIEARYVEYAGLIRRSGAHLLTIVNDLLDLSKIEAGRYSLDLERLNLNDIAAEVIRLSIDSAGKKEIALGLVTPLNPVMARADASAVRRMLINTVGNAIKFTPEGGRVILSVTKSESDVLLDTDDSGPGIPEAERGRLAQSYERGAGVRAEGAGLGLALVRALAELHGGSLSLHASHEGGALVRVRLPALAE